MNQCPCCSQTLIRCIRKDGIYWFCTSCWEEMPDLDAIAKANIKNDKNKKDREKLGSIS